MESVQSSPVQTDRLARAACCSEREEIGAVVMPPCNRVRVRDGATPAARPIAPISSSSLFLSLDTSGCPLQKIIALPGAAPPPSNRLAPFCLSLPSLIERKSKISAISQNIRSGGAKEGSVEVR